MSDAARRRLSLQARRMCRFCLSQLEPLGDIYATAGQVPLPLQVMACVAIEVFPSDGMPSTICNTCRHFMDQSYKFKQICKWSDDALRQYISHGELLEPMEWPPEMLESIPDKIKVEMNKSKLQTFETNDKQPTKKPIGRPRKHAPIEPSPSPAKIKKDECSIKITKRGDEVIVAATDDDTKKTKFYLYQSEVDDAPAATSVATGVFPCQHCERSFPLEQLRDIHAKSHTRDRPFNCNTCDRSYYSKYDLQKHEEIHSGVKAFACTVCDKKFLRLTLLQRHEKTHTSVTRYACMECERTFLTKEQLSAHNNKMHKTIRQFQCDLCPKKFAFKQGLERHYWQHTQEKSFKCDYCEEAFTSANLLSRHVHTHAGVRPYPCKFCSKSFLLSHHYTRHLRASHITKTNGDKTVKSEGVFAPQKGCYKCVQCDESFSKQDDLIFHSAIHATQDLTCPLCKEKFPDVDAVTTHIKSHIEGEQFICEWCELVFTSEEKLDMHIDIAHQDALGSDEQFNKISYLEGRLLDEPTEAEPEGGNSTDEEYDELYESSQRVDESEFTEIENKCDQSEIEVEVMPDGQLSVKMGESQGETTKLVETIDENTHVEIEIEDNLTYTELKTVAPTEYVKTGEPAQKSVEVTSKPTTETSNDDSSKKEIITTSDSPKKLISAAETSPDKINRFPVKPAPKEGEKKNFIQRLEEQKLKRAKEAALRKNEIMESKSPTGSKSLMLLEKDIQELKRNAKSGENMSSGRFLSATSTPKDNRDKFIKYNKMTDSSKEKPTMKSFAPVINKENKDESYKRDVKPHHVPARKGRPPKAIKLEEEEEDDTESSMSDGDYSEGDSSLIRRSSRPNKVKDYAALIRDGERQIGSDSDHDNDDDDDDVDEDELEEKEYRPPPLVEKKFEVIPSGKRKRGRPRKNPLPDQPEEKRHKIDKDMIEVTTEKRRVGRPSNKALQERAEQLGVTVEELKRQSRIASLKKKNDYEKISKSMYENETKKSEPMRVTSSSFVSASQAIKRTGVLVKTLPPGVKPVPLPPGAGVPPGVCQMKIGEKVVRVQKIVMTKAEVNAITKKGLIEMKNGAMILKAGVILPPNSDNKSIKSTLLSENFTESDSAQVSAASTSQQPSISSSLKDEKVPKPTRFGGDCSDEDDDN